MTCQISPQKIDVSAKILASVMHELNPARSVEEWMQHIKQHGNNPKAFFGDNGEGLAEYEAFVRTYDKETHLRNQKNRPKRRLVK